MSVLKIIGLWIIFFLINFICYKIYGFEITILNNLSFIIALIILNEKN